MPELLSIIFLFVFVGAFGAVLVYGTSLLGPKLPASDMKKAAYECGLEAQSSGHSKVPVKFYLTAILFILFDIEIIFMYPWAMTFRSFLDAGHGGYAIAAMGVFIAIFVVGLVWEIKSRALEWD